MNTEETHPRNGSINAALTTGIIGSALGALNSTNGGILGGLLGGGKQPGYVTKEEFSLNNTIMQKDGEIALLKADKYTDAKLLETYNVLSDKIDKVREKVDCNKSAQDQVNYTQGVMNATNTCTLNCMQG